MNYRVSVIVPVYNVEKHLKTCLDSVINQTYKNLEIILIDDGSTDNSSEICDEYARNDERIVVIHKENKGVSSARNKGIEIATGDFIGFVDSDDYIEPDMYEKLVSMITSDDIDIATSGYYKDFSDRKVPMKNEGEVPIYPVCVKDFLKYVYIRDKYQNVAGYIVTKIIRTTVLKKNNILFDEKLLIGEDVLFMAEVFMKSRKIMYTEKHLYHYFQNNASAYHNYRVRIDSMGSLAAYERIAELFSENNVDKNIIDYVKRFLVYHASLLLKMSYENDYLHKVDEIKSVIRKYFDAYERTNTEHPERTEEIKELMERKI